MSAIKRFLSQFSKETLLGRVRIMMLSFFLIVLVISGIVLYQNYLANKAAKRFVEIDLPADSYSKQIIAATHMVSSEQRGYLLTTDEKFEQRRNIGWDKAIFPAIRKLEQLGRTMADSNKAKIDSLSLALYRYKEMQDQLSNMYMQNLGNVNGKGSVDINSLNALQVRVMEKFSNQIEPVKATIFSILVPLSEQMKEENKERIEEIESTLRSTSFIILLLALVGLGIGGYFGFSLYWSVNQSIKRPNQLLQHLANGELPEQSEETKDELNTIIVNANALASQIRNASEFAICIGEGRYEQEYQTKGDQDVLGNALVQMRDKLKEVSEHEKAQSWLNSQLAEFGNIIRAHQSSPEALADHILSKLIKTIGALQGAIFILEGNKEDGQHLQMAGCYAYGRKKFLEQRIEIGDGLVGQAFLEKQTTKVKRIPQNYLTIDSGLGQTDPNYLVLVPLVVNTKCEGVLEIASLNTLEDYKVEFLEKIGESIAGSISSVRSNQLTQELLAQSQEQTELLQSQEEEMRQNMEEMLATQEELERVQEDLRLSVDAVDKSLFVVDFSMERKILKINQLFRNVFGYEEDFLIEKDYLILTMENEMTELDEEIWNAVTNGQIITREVEWIAKNGKKYNLNTTFAPVESGGQQKVVTFSIDISDQVALRNTLKKEKEDLKVSEGIVLDKLKKEEINTEKLKKQVQELVEKEKSLRKDLTTQKAVAKRLEETYTRSLKEKDDKIRELMSKG